MQTEVEIKARITFLLKIRKELVKIGARKKGSKRIVDIYYTPARGEKYYGKNSRLKFRIRYDGKSDHGRLEVHKISNIYSAVEYELPINNVKLAKQMLNELGFVAYVTVDKVRESYTYGKLNIVLDKVRGLGKFMEVEIMNTDEESAIKKIKEFYDQLGINKKQFFSGLTYVELAKFAKRK